MRLAAFATVVLASLTLAGCGKAGRPISPDQTPHPQLYPKVEPQSHQQPVPAKPNPDGKAMPPEWDQDDINKAFTKDGAFIDPSARQRVSAGSFASPASENIAIRSNASGRGSISEPNNQTYVDQPLTEPRP